MNLQDKALANVPLSEATVESFYDGSHSGTEKQCLRALCESHERLRMELDGATALIERIEKDIATFKKAYVHVDSVLNAVRDQRNRMAEALRPFAHQARIIDENDKLDGKTLGELFEMFRFRSSYTAITLGDCRRARAALEDK